MQKTNDEKSERFPKLPRRKSSVWHNTLIKIVFFVIFLILCNLVTNKDLFKAVEYIDNAVVFNKGNS